MSQPKSSTTPPWVRRAVDAVQAYVPGEQPRLPNLVKLNTNENPYPPSPKVLAAVRDAVDERLRLYPNPTAQALRERLAEWHGCSVENVVIGNGADEILALTVRAFVETREARVPQPRRIVQFLTPSYSLYPVLADIHGAEKRIVALNPDFGLPSPAVLKRRGWEPSAALTLVTTPNAPGGRAYSNRELARLCRGLQGVVVLDEAYVDFAETSAIKLASCYPNVLVVRTFSKSYSLCFQRVGYAIGPSRLIQALDTIRDSYNVNGLGQVAALATLNDLPYYRRNLRRVIATRQKTATALQRHGFTVFPSQTNFLLVRPPTLAAETWFQALRERGVLVRWFSDPEMESFLRITIGTNQEMAFLLSSVRAIKRDLCP